MSSPRASIFEADALDAEENELDVSGFTPKSAPDRSAPPAAEVRAVSEAANFRSREAPLPTPPVAAKRGPGRHRTGRNVQFNIKASQEAIDGFYAIAARQGWVLGETLARAVAALEQALEPAGKAR